MGNYVSYGTLIPKGIYFGVTEIFRKKELNEKEKRKVLDGEVNIEKIVEGIKTNKYKNIIVICGAGLSTAAGIPDFRSSKGFYANAKKYNLRSPMDIFSISFYKKNPKPFLELAKDLLQYEGKFFPTYSHYFLNFLHQKKRLLRVWTQNVDGLELLAGLPSSKIVEAHGHIRDCHCIKCGRGHSTDWFKEKLGEDNKLPLCKFCRSLVKPDVTFFGEALPKRFFSLFMSDFRKADLMLVIGTSLQVYPFAGLVDRVGVDVPRVLFNMETVGTFRKSMRDEENNYRDVVVLGPCDETLKNFVEDCGWKMEVPELEKNKKKNPDLLKVLGVKKKKEEDDDEEEDEGEDDDEEEEVVEEEEEEEEIIHKEEEEEDDDGEEVEEEVEEEVKEEEEESESDD